MRSQSWPLGGRGWVAVDWEPIARSVGHLHPCNSTVGLLTLSQAPSVPMKRWLGGSKTVGGRNKMWGYEEHMAEGLVFRVRRPTRATDNALQPGNPTRPTKIGQSAARPNLPPRSPTPPMITRQSQTTEVGGSGDTRTIVPRLQLNSHVD